MTIEAIDFGRLYCDHLAMTTRPRKSAADWDARAAGMASKALRSNYAQEFVARMDLLGATSLLDVGCGPGTISLTVAHRLLKVIGLDYSPAMVEAMRAKAQEAGLGHVHALQRAWEDDWSDLPPCDIVVASRSTTVADITVALGKLHAQARQRVYLTHLVGGDFIDPRIQEAVGRRVPSLPDYIYLVNILHRMGIHPRLDYIRIENRLADASDFTDFTGRVAWSMGGLSDAETGRLRDWYEHTPPGAREGAPMHWAFIAWEKTPC